MWLKNKRHIPTKLMCRLICNLPELIIRIFNPLASYLPVTKAKILRLHYRNLIEKTGVERNEKLKK